MEYSEKIDWIGVKSPYSGDVYFMSPERYKVLKTTGWIYWLPDGYFEWEKERKKIHDLLFIDNPLDLTCETMTIDYVNTELKRRNEIIERLCPWKGFGLKG